jgi:hypothetical protein
MLAVLFTAVVSLVLGTAAQSVSILQQSLTSSGVSAVYPTDANYSSVTQACEQRLNGWDRI